MFFIRPASIITPLGRPVVPELRDISEIRDNSLRYFTICLRVYQALDVLSFLAGCHWVFSQHFRLQNRTTLAPTGPGNGCGIVEGREEGLVIVDDPDSCCSEFVSARLKSFRCFLVGKDDTRFAELRNLSVQRTPNNLQVSQHTLTECANALSVRL